MSGNIAQTISSLLGLCARHPHDLTLECEHKMRGNSKRVNYMSGNIAQMVSSLIGQGKAYMESPRWSIHASTR